MVGGNPVVRTLDRSAYKGNGAQVLETGGAAGIRAALSGERHAGRSSTRSRILAGQKHRARRFAGQANSRSLVVTEGRGNPGRQARISLRSGRHTQIYADSWRVDGGPDHEQDRGTNKAWFIVAAGAAAGRLLRRHPADDGGELSRCRRRSATIVLLGRNVRWFEDRAAVRPLLAALGRRPAVLRHHSRDRNSARHLHRAQNAEIRPWRAGLPRH
jgi:hypothetical protein